MIKPHCIETLNDSKIKVEQKGKSAIINNADRRDFNRIEVDGCCTLNEIQADYVIERQRDVVVIELKGRNVEHAADQVMSTARKWCRDEDRCDRIAGLIVGRQTPGASTAMQRKKKIFQKEYGGPLHVVKSDGLFDIDCLLSFKGPLRQ